jgi:SAM-dependent methyltransferase
MHKLSYTLATQEQKSLTLKYSPNPKKISEKILKNFLPLTYDDETAKFLSSVEEMSTFHQFSIIVGKPILKLFYSNTDTNSILDCGHMFLFSSQHLNCLFEGKKFEKLLDIGAGNGLITEKFKSFCAEISCTEVSSKMIDRLKEKQFNVFEDPDIQSIKQEFDLIACLNVLDRCEKPVTLIHDMKKKLKNEDSRILVSIVFPMRQKVEGGIVRETLIKEGLNWEKSVEEFSKLFEKHNLEIEKLSRLPYLSQGDVISDYYVLDCAIFILKLGNN